MGPSFEGQLFNIKHYEEKLIDWFGNLATHPRWFTTWVIAYVCWAWMHNYLHFYLPWYDDTKDFIVVTGLFSCVPFWVENSLKRSQAQAAVLAQATLEEIKKQTELIKQTLELHDIKDDAHFAVLSKVVDVLESKGGKRGGRKPE